MKANTTPFIPINGIPGFIPIGMAKGNLYYIDREDDLTHEDISKRVGVNYYRPVSQEDLDEYRDEDNIKEYYRSWWAEAVKDGYTDLSLKDWIDNENEINLENPEWYPNRDEDVVENIEACGDLRRIADMYAQAYTHKKVGTWEWGGCGWLEEKFDVVFSHPEFAERLEREAGLR